MMVNTFNPSTEITDVVTANVKSGKKINDKMFRIRAEVSSIEKNGWSDAIRTALKEDVRLVKASFYEIEDSPGGKIVEGIAIASPESYRVSSKDWKEEAGKLGLNVRKLIGKNMYLDDHEQVWNVEVYGDTTVIMKESGDDIDQLIASITSVNPNTDKDIKAIVKPGEVAKVAYVSGETGGIAAGIMFAKAEGTKDRVQILRIGQFLNEEPEIASIYQIVAKEEFEDLDPEEYGDIDPIDYYRKVYSDDPAMMDTLEQLVDVNNIEV